MLRPASRVGAAVVVTLGLAMGPASKGERSLSDLDIEFSEAKVTLQAVSEENASLKRRLKESQEAVKSLTESLAVANGEAELFRKETVELKLRMEALGVEGLSADRGKVEQRLLKAVRDLQLLQEEKDKLADELVQLLEAVMRFTKGADDAEARLALEARMRSAAELLGLPGEGTHGAGKEASKGGDLTDAMVISVKEELRLVLMNIGTRQGVRVGMPFRVLRDGKDIGSVRVVDPREKISGAVIQSLDSEKNRIKVGDRLKVDAR